MNPLTPPTPAPYDNSRGRFGWRYLSLVWDTAGSYLRLSIRVSLRYGLVALALMMVSATKRPMFGRRVGIRL